MSPNLSPSPEPIRLGEIQFINTSPFEWLVSHNDPWPVTVHQAPPKQLNEQLLGESLDVSGISSACYLRHQDQLVLLPELSISAEGAVKSVLFLMPTAWTMVDETAPTYIWVPTSSETSIALLAYILARRYGWMPYDYEFRPYLPDQTVDVIATGEPVLSIGDEALKLNMNPPMGFDCLDLARIWYDYTQTPFVFGVWAARRSWADMNPLALAYISAALCEKKRHFQTNPKVQEALIHGLHRRAPWCSAVVLRQYLTQALSYDLGEAHLQGLQIFQSVLQWLEQPGLVSLPWAEAAVEHNQQDAFPRVG